MIMGKYVIVVESGSDVTPELCERYGIVRVPMHVTIGDETVEDGSIDPLEIYSRCNEFGVMPKTSGCAPADFAHVYDRIHAEQPDATILHLAYSEATTCSHQSSKIAAQGRDYVFSMDTRFCLGRPVACCRRDRQIHRGSPRCHRRRDLRLRELRHGPRAVGLCPNRSRLP